MPERAYYRCMKPASSRSLAQDVSLREVWAWSMYDFANSGYTTVVITAVFSAFFVAGVAGKAPWATFAWTAALSVSYLAVLLTAPLVGAWADAHAAKKRLLFYSTVGCVLFTALLWFASPGAVALAIVLVVLSNFFFATGENLIAAFLPILFTGIAKATGRGYNNNAPRAFQEKLNGYRQRAHWAHLNGFEAFPVFAAGVLMAAQQNVAQDRIDQLAVGFIAARVLYGAFYLLDWASLRSLAWVAGFGCSIALMIAAIRAG